MSSKIVQEIRFLTSQKNEFIFEIEIYLQRQKAVIDARICLIPEFIRVFELIGERNGDEEVANSDARYKLLDQVLKVCSIPDMFDES